MPIEHGKGPIVLIDINGNAPTEKEKETFEKDHPARIPQQMDSQGVELKDIVSPGTLRFENQNDDICTFSFTPQLAFAGEPDSDYPLHGFIEYDAKDRYLMHFKVTSYEAFKPRFGMHVNYFEMDIRIAQLEDKSVVIQNIHTQFEGKAFLVAKIQKDTELTFFNYHPPIAMETSPLPASNI